MTNEEKPIGKRFAEAMSEKKPLVIHKVDQNIKCLVREGELFVLRDDVCELIKKIGTMPKVCSCGETLLKSAYAILAEIKAPE